MYKDPIPTVNSYTRFSQISIVWQQAYFGINDIYSKNGISDQVQVSKARWLLGSSSGAFTCISWDFDSFDINFSCQKPFFTSSHPYHSTCISWDKLSDLCINKTFCLFSNDSLRFARILQLAQLHSKNGDAMNNNSSFTKILDMQLYDYQFQAILHLRHSYI